MNEDEYGEIINGAKTYLTIAEDLLNGKNVIIGWTDQGCDHRDILFSFRLNTNKYGTLQRGLNWNSHLYVSIMDHSCMGFLVEGDRDNTQHPSYIKEKLRLNDNSCDDKICELINGVIACLDKLRGNR